MSEDHLVDLYQQYLDDGPPRRGHGPWWVVLAFNIAPKARLKTDIWFHSTPALQIAVANHTERGFSRWVPALEVGPFRYERSAATFYEMWCSKSSKERTSRVLWCFALYEMYKDEENLQLNVCSEEALRLQEDEAKKFAVQQRAAQKEKRGRYGDMYSRRHRLWDMSPEEDRRVTCGSLGASRALRERHRRQRNRK
jgi:hypothetical protein